LCPGKRNMAKLNELNFYRTRKLANGKHLITVDSGDWIVLSDDKFQRFKDANIEDDFFLYNILKDKFVVLTDENRQEYARRLRSRYSHLFSGPSLHIVAVTARCNNICTYCHANARITDDKSLDMKKDVARRTVDFIFQSPNRNITIEFQGGEPLLHLSRDSL